VALINAVRRCAAPITHIAVKNPAIDAAELHGKYIILDLLAEDAAGRQYNIEMQVRRYRAWSWDVGVRSSPQPTGSSRPSASICSTSICSRTRRTRTRRCGVLRCAMPRARR
jgi:hypothetical protein